MNKEKAKAIISSKLAYIVYDHRMYAKNIPNLQENSLAAEEEIIAAATVFGFGSEVLHKTNLLNK